MKKSLNDKLNFANYGVHWAASTPFGSYFLNKASNGLWIVQQSFMSPAKLATKNNFQDAEYFAQEDYSRRLAIATQGVNR